MLLSKKEIKTRAEKPPLCKVALKAIPEELKKYPRWVFWKWVRKKGEWTKVPYDPHTGARAKPNDPSTWGTWEDITRVPAWQRKQFDGIGFFFHEDDGFVGIDLDDAVDLATGELKPWAKEKIDKLASYAEKSPTLTGVKMIARGKKPGNKCKTAFADGEIEIYERARFFCLTGQRLPETPATVEERPEQITEVYFEVFGKPEEKKKPQTSRPQPETRSLADDELTEKARAAKNGDKFARLLAGDTSDYDGDDSKADAAFCAMLAFWSDRDAAQMDRIFRSSGLMRDKWDDRRGEQTYGQRTIDEACSLVQETYRGSRRRSRSSTTSENGNGHSAISNDQDEERETELANAGETLVGLLEKVKEDAEHAIEASLQADALRALGLLALEDSGRTELFYRELRKAGGKSRDIDGLRRAVNQERKRIKQERIETAQQTAQNIPRSYRLLTNFDEQKVQTPTGPQTLRTGLPPASIMMDLLGLTKGWPRRWGQTLFAVSENAPLWLDSPPALFAWAHNFVGSEKGSGVYWTGEGVNMVSRAEFYAYLSQSVGNYRAVEVFPHWPAMPEHYYIHPPLEGGDGESLRGMVHRFSPATLADHDLIEALFLSLFWGGAPGSRPAWLITTDAEDEQAGRGVGKSILAQFAAELVGGYVALDSDDKMPDVYTRLLSPEGQLKRVLLLDNLKTLKFSWSQLESFITATNISGHQMYEGEGSRPNTVMVIITLNGASLSKDMAQRCNIIKLKRPEKYSAKWEEETRLYILKHRWAIIGDIIARLQAPAKELGQSDRWASWGRDVLSRVSDPAECHKVLMERRGDVDEDNAEGDIVRQHFVDRLTEREHDPEHEVIFIPSAVVGEWVNGATGERRAVPKACSYLNQLNVKGLRRSKYEGRGFVWTGRDIKPGQKIVDLNHSPFGWSPSGDGR